MPQAIIALDGREALVIRHDLAHGCGILTEKLELHARHWCTCFTGKGIDERFLAGKFPRKADVGKLDDRLGAALCRICDFRMRRSDDIEEI